MSYKPILFSTPMVQAILEGRKSMTRRVVKGRYDKERQRFARMGLFAAVGIRNGLWHGLSPEGIPFVNDEIEQPRFQPGDILWVRETWVPYAGVNCACKYYGYECKCEPYWYRADPSMNFANECEPPEDRMRWHPSMFMPKAACRIFLRVDAVFAERLQDISEADAIREGITYTDFGMNTHQGKMSVDGGVTFHDLKPEHYPGYHAGDVTGPDECHAFARFAFAHLWENINGKGKYSWDTNPWVWVIEFTRVEKPEGWPCP